MGVCVGKSKTYRKLDDSDCLPLEVKHKKLDDNACPPSEVKPQPEAISKEIIEASNTSQDSSLSVEQVAELRRDLEALRVARLLELGVSEATASSTMPISCPPAAEPANIRVMQWNLLADGLSDDGFLVPRILADWPAGPEQMPSNDGTPVDFTQLIQEIVASEGKEEELKQLKAKYDVPIAKANFDAVIDWKVRELQIQLTIIAAGRPDILIFQELDHYSSLANGLLKLGYSSKLCDAQEYIPAHMAGHHVETAEGISRFRDFVDEAGHSFSPVLGSTAMRLRLEGHGFTECIKTAANELGIGDQVLSEDGKIAKTAFLGLPDGTGPLLRAAGLDPESFDDMGVAIFWRTDRLAAQGLKLHVFNTESGKGSGATLAVRLKDCKSGQDLTVFGAHLKSGSSPDKEELRLTTQVNVADGLCSLLKEYSRESAVIVGLDANSHPQIIAPDGQSSVWRSIHECSFESVWDKYFGSDGGSLSDDARDPPVTVNKIRGPLSRQASKIGTHAYYCIDYVFFDPQRLTMRGHALEPKRFPSSSSALPHVLPTLSNPSDHYPVVVDVGWASKAE